MDRKIILYGHGLETFESPQYFTDYIERGVFEDCDSRYRYSQKKRADIVVLSLAGTIYGHFETDSEVQVPTANDMKEWPDSRGVYIVRKSVVYRKPVQIAYFGFRGIQFGKKLSEAEFADVLKQAGETSDSTLPQPV